MNALRIFAWAASSVAFALLAAPPAAAQLSREKSLEIEQLWEDCREVWFEGHEHLSGLPKIQFFESLSGDRQLGQKHKDCILRVANLLIDKQWPSHDRDDAAVWLGDMGHAYCIPALLAVLRDEEDNSDVRVDCVIALSHIADKRVVDPLIDAMAGKDSGVACHAWRQLNKMLFRPGWGDLPEKIPHPGFGRGIGWQDDLAWRKELEARYRAWWEKNRDDVKLNRGATYSH